MPKEDSEPTARYISFSLPAGATDRDAVERIAKECKIAIGKLPAALSETQLARAQALFGQAGSCLNEIADQYKVKWWLEDGKLYMGNR